MYSINVLVLTYKQAHVIGRALDSVLSQKEFGLNKIIVQDDHSPDNNWEVIQDYQKKYPDYITCYQNETNLGIYGNKEALFQNRGEADFYIDLSGDDALENGLFEAIQNKATEKNIDVSESVAIFYDWRSEDPHGNGYYFNQNLVDRGYKPFSLFIRQRCYERGLVASKGLKNKHDEVVLTKGLNLAEYIADTQCIRKAEKWYYMPICGSIYYTGIGVAQTLTDTSYYKDEEIIKLNYFLEHFATAKKDIYWLKALLYKTDYIISRHTLSFIKMCWYYLLGLEYYDMNIKSAKRFWSFLKRL